MCEAGASVCARGESFADDVDEVAADETFDGSSHEKSPPWKKWINPDLPFRFAQLGLQSYTQIVTKFM